MSFLIIHSHRHYTITALSSVLYDHVTPYKYDDKKARDIRHSFLSSEQYYA